MPLKTIDAAETPLAILASAPPTLERSSPTCVDNEGETLDHILFTLFTGNIVQLISAFFAYCCFIALNISGKHRTGDDLHVL